MSNRLTEILFWLTWGVLLLNVARIIVKVFPKTKKQYLYLIHKNKNWGLLILALNLLITPFIYLFYKLYILFPYWQVLAGEIVFFALVFFAFNLNIIPALFQSWYHKDEETKEIKPNTPSDAKIIFQVVVALLFLALVIIYLFYPHLLPAWLYNLLLNWNN